MNVEWAGAAWGVCYHLECIIHIHICLVSLPSHVPTVHSPTLGVPLVDTLRSLIDVQEGASADSVLGAGAASLSDMLAEFQHGGNDDDAANRQPAVIEARVSAAHADDSLFD